MTADEIYELLHQVLEPFNRGLDLDRKTALDGLLDIASRKIAANVEVAMVRCQWCDTVQPCISGRSCDCGSNAFRSLA